MMGSWGLLTFDSKGDDRGQLVAVQNDLEIPFAIKRVYYMRNVEMGVERGKHAHRNLEQVLIAVYGSCDVTVDNGLRKEKFHLDSFAKGLRIKDLVWREMSNFSPDCVLLVLASELYDVNDYIRDYSEFKRLALECARENNVSL